MLSAKHRWLLGWSIGNRILPKYIYLNLFLLSRNVSYFKLLFLESTNAANALLPFAQMYCMNLVSVAKLKLVRKINKTCSTKLKKEKCVHRKALVLMCETCEEALKGQNELSRINFSPAHSAKTVKKWNLRKRKYSLLKLMHEFMNTKLTPAEMLHPYVTFEAFNGNIRKLKVRMFCMNLFTR